MSKYNRSETKSERPVDRAIRLSNTLRTQFRCQDNIGRTLGEFETLSKFYDNKKAVKDVMSFMISCNVLVETEKAEYFKSEEGLFNDNGKNLLEAVLSAIILDKEAIQAGDLVGVKRLRAIIISSLPVLVKHQTIEPNYTQALNEAVVLEKKIYASGIGFKSYVTQYDLFNARPSREALILNRLLNKGRNTFKSAMHKFNEAIILNQTPSLMNDNKTPKEIWDFYIEKQIDESDLKAIDLLTNHGGAMDSKKESEAKQQADENKRKRLRLRKMKQMNLLKLMSI
jgi:hypothetical protein